MSAVISICLILWLCLCSAEDLRLQQMHTPLLLFGSIMGVLFHLLFHHLELTDLLCGLLTGLALFLLCRVGKGVIGEGDALLFMATGTFLGWKGNLMLLWGALLFAGFFGVLYLLVKRKRHAQLPFAPFVTVAYLAGLALGGVG